MRDYKHVKVPKQYRKNRRVSVKRVSTGSGPRSPAAGRGGAKKALVTLLVASAVVSGCWLAWEAHRMIMTARLLQVSGVDVKGLHRLGDADIKPVVGEFTGQNIFAVDLEAAAQRARMNPWIKDVRIYRSLPNRITMKVVEREPYAVLQTEAGRYLVDNDMVVIDHAGRDEQAGVYPVIAIRNYRARPGEQVLTGGMESAMQLLKEIAARGGWSPGEVTVKAGSPESLSVLYADREFKIGSGRYDEKLRRLAEVMDDVKARGLDIAYVDLRPERQAAVKVKAEKTGVSDSGRQSTDKRR